MSLLLSGDSPSRLEQFITYPSVQNSPTSSQVYADQIDRYSKIPFIAGEDHIKFVDSAKDLTVEIKKMIIYGSAGNLCVGTYFLTTTKKEISLNSMPTICS
jgi:hypothetical protein